MVIHQLKFNDNQFFVLKKVGDTLPNYSPLRYPGGKSKIYNYIRNLIKINKCTSYIEPFAGGSGVALKLLINNDVKKIIINDIDRSVYAVWHSIINKPNELIQMIEDTPVNMESWFAQKNIQINKEHETLLNLGFSTLFLNRTNRSGIIKAGVIGGKNQDGKYKIDCRFNKESIIKKINLISNYKNKIEIFNMDAMDFIDQIIKRTRNSFTFFDPPYFEKGPSLYTNFYSVDDHIDLSLKIKNDLKNRKWIVTYDNSYEIKEMYNNLKFIEYYLTYTAQDKKKGIEFMFFSHKTKIGAIEKYLKLYEPLFLTSK